MSTAESERCVESRNTVRNTPVVATAGISGGDWFDYSAISPLESSPITPLTARAYSDDGGTGGRREDRRSWGMGRQWEEVGVMGARVGDRGSKGSRGSRGSMRHWTFEEMGLGENRASKGWMPVPSEERASSEGRSSNEV